MITSEPALPRTPIAADDIAVSDTAVHLYDTAAQGASGGWLIQAIGGTVYLGDDLVRNTHGLALKQDVVHHLASSSLKGWYVWAASALSIKILGLQGGP